MTQSNREKNNRPLILNFVILPAPSQLSPANWAHPTDISRDYTKLKYWVDLAKLAESAKINSVFIADSLGPYDVLNGPRNFDAVARSGAQFPLVDPSVFISAMADATESVGFGCTFSTISEAPYHFARRLASLDHATNGRIGWNVVTSYLDSASRNLIGTDLLPHDERYDKADEYIDVVYKLLLSSWRDDSIVVDTDNLIFAEPSRIREINHEGKYFNVPGPHVTEPSPQRFPVVFQAGASPRGILYSAKHAEVVFVAGFKAEEVKRSVDTTRKIAVEKYGRDPDHLKFIVGIQLILGETHEEAELKFLELLKYQSYEGKQALISGWSGWDLGKYGDDEQLENTTSEGMLSAVKQYLTDNPTKTKREIVEQVGLGRGRKKTLIGTGIEVADELEKYVQISGVDGFNLLSTHSSGSFTDVVKYLLPELRRRGLAREDYPVPGGTFRENLLGKRGQIFVPEDHYAHGFRWSEGSKDEFRHKLNRHIDQWAN